MLLTLVVGERWPAGGILYGCLPQLPLENLRLCKYSTESPNDCG
jgi:hypothetical protein